MVARCCRIPRHIAETRGVLARTTRTATRAAGGVMSDANVKLVQSLYDAFKRGDIPTIINALAPDVDWQVHGDPKDFPPIGRWTGPDGAQDFFRTIAQHLDVGEFTP